VALPAEHFRVLLDTLGGGVSLQDDKAAAGMIDALTALLDRSGRSEAAALSRQLAASPGILSLLPQTVLARAVLESESPALVTSASRSMLVLCVHEGQAVIATLRTLVASQKDASVRALVDRYCQGLVAELRTASAVSPAGMRTPAAKRKQRARFVSVFSEFCRVVGPIVTGR
jgi:hypothetical protein